MGITPHTNITLEELAERLLDNEYVQICGHASPDGDCIGSALALKLALEQHSIKVDVLLALKDPAPKHYDFLPGFSELQYSGHIKKTADAFLMIDTPNDKRMGFAATKLKDSTPKTFTLDHHAEPERATQFTYTDTSAASTTVLVWELLDFMDVEKTPDIALCCFAGLSTDTGNFQYQNTDVRAFKCATEMVEAGANPSLVSENVYMRRSLASYKLQSKIIENMDVFDGGAGAISSISLAEIEETGAVKGDFDAMINVLRSLDGTRVVAVVREDKKFVKVSLRSLGDIDVRAIAGKFGGGGHKGAAGVVMEDPLPEVVFHIKQAMQEALQNS